MVRIGLDGKLDRFPLPKLPIHMGNALLFEPREEEMWVFSSGGLIPTDADMDRVVFIDHGEPRLSGRYHRRADGTEHRRQWRIRYLHPHQLDQLCARAGFRPRTPTELKQVQTEKGFRHTINGFYELEEAHAKALRREEE